jgi:hypothetical protein
VVGNSVAVSSRSPANGRQRVKLSERASVGPAIAAGQRDLAVVEPNVLRPAARNSSACGSAGEQPACAATALSATPWLPDATENAIGFSSGCVSAPDDSASRSSWSPSEPSSQPSPDSPGVWEMATVASAAARYRHVEPEVTKYRNTGLDVIRRAPWRQAQRRRTTPPSSRQRRERRHGAAVEPQHVSSCSRSCPGPRPDPTAGSRYQAVAPTPSDETALHVRSTDGVVERLAGLGRETGVLCVPLNGLGRSTRHSKVMLPDTRPRNRTAAPTAAVP